MPCWPLRPRLIWPMHVATAAGVPVLVEKPPAPDLAGAADLVPLSPTPWLGFQRRFRPRARWPVATTGMAEPHLTLELEIDKAAGAPTSPATTPWRISRRTSSISLPG